MLKGFISIFIYSWQLLKNSRTIFNEYSQQANFWVSFIFLKTFVKSTSFFSKHVQIEYPALELARLSLTSWIFSRGGAGWTLDLCQARLNQAIFLQE